MKIDLNCDLGEGIGRDEAIMPFITSANIACGFHAGDENTMRETIRLAKKFNVNVGAHPSWNDRENFGRKMMILSIEQTEEIVFHQISLLAEIAKAEGVDLVHVKPHGALYNQASQDIDFANTIAKAVKRFSKGEVTSPLLIGLAGSRLCEAGLEMGLRVANEGFPDRAYNSDGSLMSRSIVGAVIESPEEVAVNAIKLIQTGKIDTLCLHGDNIHAVENAIAVRKVLDKNRIEVVGLKNNSHL